MNKTSFACICRPRCVKYIWFYTYIAHNTQLLIHAACLCDCSNHKLCSRPTTTQQEHNNVNKDNYFATAAVAADSSHMTALSSASWSRFKELFRITVTFKLSSSLLQKNNYHVLTLQA